MSNSEKVTTDSLELIRNQISQKLDCNNRLYFNLSGPSYLKHTVTDYDEFPYQRFFRGVYYKDNPVVMEREAGWRPRIDKCYKPAYTRQANAYPNHCFQSPCSTVYPCYPDVVKKYADKEELDILLNRICVDKSP